MMNIKTKTLLVCIAVTSLTPMFAQTAWTSPEVLSTGGQGWQAAAAIDGNGNSVALWDERTTQDQMWSRSKTGAGDWGSDTQVSPALLTVSTSPAVRISATGFATAVWTDSSGIWTADRPTASQWNPSQLLIPGGSSPTFIMDSQGDAAVIWTVGGGPRATSGSVMAVVRPAGGAWTPQQTIASGVHITANHAGIAANGTMIVTWESYNAVCGKYCTLSNFVLHASRQVAASSTWADSGPLLGPDTRSHDGLVTLDSTGGAMLVGRSASGAYTSAAQGVSGGAWSPFQTVVDPGSSMTTDLASDNAGHVTLVYESIGFPASQVLAVSGSMSSNTWSPPVVVSGSDTSLGSVHFALASSGMALAVWMTNGATSEVHAVIRATATGSWGSPVTVSGPGTSAAPEAAAASSSGKAVVIYSGYDAAGVHNEYATQYQP